MARLPLDPRLGRALLESQRFHAQSELLAVVSGLSVPDARIANVNGVNADGASTDGANEDPAQSAGFEDSKSEFSSLIKLWRAYRTRRRGPRRDLVRWCKERGLSLLRLSEWEDVYTQVADRAAEIGIVAQRKPASYTGVHRALLAGFCTMVGTRGDDGGYLGTRGTHFYIFPGSPLKRRRPRWVMAANIVETSRVFARRVADIEPMWIEAAARHLLQREYLEPDWDEEREEVVARERVSLLGLTITRGRVVNYGPIAPEESRLIFAREALAYGRLNRRPDWLRDNDHAIVAAQAMEERLRTRDLLRAPEFFVEFYDKALPRQVSSAATLDYFTRHLSHAQRAALTLGPEQVLARAPDPLALAQFPERVQLAGCAAAPGVAVPVAYRFAPGEDGDGATLEIPLLVLPSVTRATMDAAVPGFAAPRVEALLRSLPKDARRTLIPIASTAAAFIEYLDLATPSTKRPELADWLQHSRGVPAALIRFDLDAVPKHLIAQLAVIAPLPVPASTAMADASAGVAATRELARGSDLSLLRRRCAARVRAELDHRARGAYPQAWRRFEADELPLNVAIAVDDGYVSVYPALARHAPGVRVGYEWSSEEAARTTGQGATMLARLMLERQARELGRTIAADIPLALLASPYLPGDALQGLLLELAFRRACFDDGPPPRTRAAFEAAVEAARERLHPALEEVMSGARTWFTEARAVRRLLDDPRARTHGELAEESRAHLRRLLDSRNIEVVSIDWLRQLTRYIKAEERRWQRLLTRGSEPPQILRELNDWTARGAHLSDRVAAEKRWLPQLDELLAMIEEYRVSLYAQELRTQGPVSAARLKARAEEIDDWITR
jgi:ATP-dependent helicase HrpA